MAALPTLDHFNVVFQSKQVKNPEDAQFFFLGENHKDLPTQRLTAEFIKKCMAPVNVLLREAYPNELIKDPALKNRLLERSQLDISLSDQFVIHGWDDCDNEIQETFERIDDLDDQMIFFSGERELLALKLKLLLMDKLLLLIKETFPDRTKSMIETVEKIKSLKNFKGKVFLIAGSDHLRTCKKELGNPAFSLDSFYQAIADLNAVVLIPKGI